MYVQPQFGLSYGLKCLIFCPDWDIVFPDDEREANPASFKFLEMAHKWKTAQIHETVANADPMVTQALAPEPASVPMAVAAVAAAAAAAPAPPVSTTEPDKSTTSNQDSDTEMETASEEED
jgi:crooked neck